jgi:hypothetical protein
MITRNTLTISLISIVATLSLAWSLSLDQENNRVQSPGRGIATPDIYDGHSRTIRHQTQFEAIELPGEQFRSAPETKEAKTMTFASIAYFADRPIFIYPELDQIEDFENLPPAEALKGLQPMLSDPDPVIRLAALESLATMDYPGIPAALTAALHDPIPQIRIEALEALALQGDAASITDIEACLFDANQLVRITAIDTLAELESEAAVNSLASLLNDGDAVIRHHTVNALGEIGGDNAISYLSTARYDPDETIRANAEAILLELGHQASY